MVISLMVDVDRIMDDFRRSFQHGIFSIFFLVLFLQGCAPATTEEDHPYYLNYRDSKQALSRVIETRPDGLFIFPTAAPEGVNDIMSYTTNEHLKQMFYVYQDVKVETCIAISPEKCSERQEGESEYLIDSGTHGDKTWRVFATATTEGLITTEQGGHPTAPNTPTPPNTWGSMDSPPQEPQHNESVNRVLQLWAKYTFTTDIEPAWVATYAQDPLICEPECY